MKKYFLSVLIALFAIEAFSQDKVELNSGQTIKGKITYLDKELLIISNSSNTYNCPLKDVKSAYKDDKILDLTIIGEKDIESILKSKLTAGDELIKASKIYFTGIGISLAGLAISGCSLLVTSNDNPDIRTGIVAVGGAVGLVGVVIGITSYTHIKLAGEKLNLSTGKDGISLSLKL